MVFGSKLGAWDCVLRLTLCGLTGPCGKYGLWCVELSMVLLVAVGVCGLELSSVWDDTMVEPGRGMLAINCACP